VRVTTRVKIYDLKCPGLGVYNLETFTTDDARSTVYGPWTRRRLPRLSASRKAQTTRRGRCSSFARIVA
jgi:hypothetical protein